MEHEIWKPVAGFEGKYEVSDKGHVRRLSYVKHTKRNGDVVVPTKQLNLLPQNSGYLRVALISSGTKHWKSKLVHRLVAEAFIPNPDNYPIVNHKDEDKTNNCVDNLEWCTQSHNMTWNRVNEKTSNKLKGRPAHNRKSVIDLNSGTVYNSLSDCQAKVHIGYYNIKDMLDGKTDEYKQFRLRYIN